MSNVVIRTLSNMSAEELDAMRAAEREAEVIERTRQLSAEEVTAMLIKQQINTLSVDDNTALRMLEFYPAFTDMIGKTVDKSGFKVQHNGKLFTTLQPTTTFQGQYEPGAAGMESLFAEICETHEGTLDDPIPYSGNMALENGKYYTQDGVTYLCNRSTGNPVYNTLSELVGLYVEIAA